MELLKQISQEGPVYTVALGDKRYSVLIDHSGETVVSPWSRNLRFENKTELIRLSDGNQGFQEFLQVCKLFVAATLLE